MKALVLAGGFPQIALIKELKRRGYFVLLADYNDNPVAKEYADRFYQESTLDVEAIRRVAKDENVDLIITVCTDQSLLTVAQVSEELGLPCYIDYKTALNVTNKLYMKKIFADNDIPSAKHIIISEFNQSCLDGLSFPVIIKPVDCNSSKGVVKAFDIEAAKTAFGNACRYSRTGGVIVEEFKEGLELSIEVFVKNGTAKVLSISCSEKIKSDDQFIIYREKYPSGINDNAEKQIGIIAQKIADAFSLSDSPMLIQAIWDGKDINVIEFSARTGGGVKHYLIKTLRGIDIIKETVNLTLGIEPNIEFSPSEAEYILNEYIYCYPGRFKCLKNFKEAKNDGIIKDYYLFKWEGAEFDTITSSGDRIAGFTVQDNSIEAITKKHNAAVKALEVLDESDNDIMRHDLLLKPSFD